MLRLTRKGQIFSLRCQNPSRSRISLRIATRIVLLDGQSNRARSCSIESLADRNLHGLGRMEQRVGIRDGRSAPALGRKRVSMGGTGTVVW